MKYLFKIILFTLLLNTSVSCASLNKTSATIERVVDGDTFVTAKGVKVRMACIDTFESTFNKRSLRQAEEYNISQVEVVKRGKIQKENLRRYEGRRVTLFYDPDKKYDLYGRLIAVVMLKDTDETLNKGKEYMSNTILCSLLKRRNYDAS